MQQNLESVLTNNPWGGTKWQVPNAWKVEEHF